MNLVGGENEPASECGAVISTAPEELWKPLLNARSLPVYYSAEGAADVVEFELTGIKAEKLPGF